MLKIKSKYIIKRIFENINKKKYLQLIKYNKTLQDKLNKSIKSYIEYNQIEILLIPVSEEKKKTIIFNREIKIKPFTHFYINGSNNEYISYDFDTKDIFTIKMIIDFNLKSLKGLFKNYESLKEINIIKCNRKDIKNMSEMFYGCKNLDKLNITNLKTDKVTDMSYMFSGCLSLENINLLNFDTSNVTNMQNMFERCTKVEELNLYNFDTSNVIYMNDMFYECKSLKSLNINVDIDNTPLIIYGKNNSYYDSSSSKISSSKNWNTHNVINMSHMFYNCSSLKELYISELDTYSVIDMSYMFYNCSSIHELKLSGFNFSNVINMSNMFDKCKSLSSLYIPNFNAKNGARVKCMFYNLNTFAKIKLRNEFININNNAFEDSKDFNNYQNFSDQIFH